MTARLLIPCLFLFLSACSVHVYHHGKKGACVCSQERSKKSCNKCSSGKCAKKQCSVDVKQGKGCCCSKK